MKEKTFSLLSEDGSSIFIREWSPEKKEEIKGTIQIIHGMVEHSERYRRFAERLCNEGFVVFANDHRGHGYTAEKEEELGHLKANEWDRMVQDVYQLTVHCRNSYPKKPLFIFGHSMGSFILRNYIYIHGNEINGAIISGTGYNGALTIKIGELVAKREIRKYGIKHRSKFITKSTFGSYNKKIKEAKTDFDWLTRDRNEVKKYIEDKYCGMICTSMFYANLFWGLKQIHNFKNVDKIPKSLPILIISGGMDPVGNYGSAAVKLIKLYRKTGMTNLCLRVYESCRHELLNEINRDAVFDDVIQWIESEISKIKL